MLSLRHVTLVAFGPGDSWGSEDNFFDNYCTLQPCDFIPSTAAHCDQPGSQAGWGFCFLELLGNKKSTGTY